MARARSASSKLALKALAAGLGAVESGRAVLNASACCNETDAGGEAATSVGDPAIGKGGAGSRLRLAISNGCAVPSRRKFIKIMRLASARTKSAMHKL